jgi:hypothetical protein
MGEISGEAMETYQDIAHNLLEVGEEEKEKEKEKETERGKDGGKEDVLLTTATLGPGKGRPGSRRGWAILKSRAREVAGEEGGESREAREAGGERREAREARQ